ncbi:MAG: acyltransferase family protein [Oscillospiraceae bacterium]|nr:acyltransferase family protein [Oscillospiraceae bacterium]
MTEKISQRNQTMDLLKLLSAYMIVFIHINFYGQTGLQIVAVARYAVPFFFVVSGYFSAYISEATVRRRILRLLYLFIYSEIIYIIFKLYQYYNIGGMEKLISFFDRFKLVKTYTRLFIFNTPLGSTHLWFLPALIYVYIIYLLIIKFKISDRLCYTFAILLLSVCLFFCEISPAMGNRYEEYLSRNFLFTGLPFFIFGLFVKKNEAVFRKLPLYAALLSFLTGLLFTFISLNKIGKCELYFGSLFIMLGAVMLSVKYSHKTYSSAVLILSACSTNIYIFHKIVYDILVIVLENRSIDTSGVFFTNIIPFLICVLTSVLAIILNLCSKNTRKLIKKQ